MDTFKSVEHFVRRILGQPQRVKLSILQAANADHSVVTQKPTLKRRVLKGSLWTFVGHSASQILRLVSNLILTRLLFPEAFGLMALAQTFIIGLEMFSDVGILPSIIQNEHGDDPKFLNTAWTIQVIRGTILAILASLIAWPVAQFYHEPMLQQLLPAIGLTAFISGFRSTKLATANRKLTLGKLTVLDLGSYLVGLVIMIVGAWLYRSVWALVIGGLVSCLVQTIATHVYLEGERNRFYWDQASFKELHHFGRWIFLSTVIGFLANQGDRLILARLLDVRFLGIYTVALGLANSVDQLIKQVSNKVLFPSYAELVRERPEDLYLTLRKARLTLITLSLSFLMLLVLFGKPIVDILYDDRYIQAGWILRVLAIGLVANTLSSTYGDVLLAKGKSFIMMMRVVINTSIQFIAMYLGNNWGGYHGLIIGLAVAEWLGYVADAIIYSRLAVWQPEVDLPVIAISCGMVGIVYFT